MKKINVLQFICPVGFYGAERWVLALVNNSDMSRVRYDLAVTEEVEGQSQQFTDLFKTEDGELFRLKMSSRFDWSVVNKLTKVINDRKIDVIHTHGYKSDILGYLAARKAGIKCISTPHGFGLAGAKGLTGLKMNTYIKLGALFLRRFDKVVPLSDELTDDVLGFGVPKKKVMFIRNGVDLKEVEKCRLHQSSPRGSSVKKIGFIGQIIPRKNVKDILDVFNTIYGQLGNVELILLGDGGSRDEVENYSRTLQSREQIQFLGFRTDRMNYLQQFDLFVMTSKNEGIPRCLMEAMAMGVPVAAYNIKGIDQLIEHNKTGLLAEYGDKDKLAQYWLTLLTDERKAAEVSRSARKFVLERFSAERMAREYVTLFSELIA